VDDILQRLYLGMWLSNQQSSELLSQKSVAEHFIAVTIGLGMIGVQLHVLYVVCEYMYCQICMHNKRLERN